MRSFDKLLSRPTSFHAPMRCLWKEEARAFQGGWTRVTSGEFVRKIFTHLSDFGGDKVFDWYAFGRERARVSGEFRKLIRGWETGPVGRALYEYLFMIFDGKNFPGGEPAAAHSADCARLKRTVRARGGSSPSLPAQVNNLCTCGVTFHTCLLSLVVWARVTPDHMRVHRAIILTSSSSRISAWRRWIWSCARARTAVRERFSARS